MAKTNISQPDHSNDWLEQLDFTLAFKAYCTEGARLYNRVMNILNETENYLLYIEKEAGLSSRMEKALASCDTLLEILAPAFKRNDISLEQKEPLQKLEEFVTLSKKHMETVQAMYEVLHKSKVTDTGLYMDTLHSIKQSLQETYYSVLALQDTASAVTKQPQSFSHL
jgi:23S rRNA G2069 N7-methylase RlmK/C1962 C5-methylase RlmI